MNAAAHDHRRPHRAAAAVLGAWLVTAVPALGAIAAPDPEHATRLALAQAFVRSLGEVHAGVRCVQEVTRLDDRASLIALMGQFRCAAGRYHAAARALAPWRADADEWVRTTATAAFTAYTAMEVADREMIPLLERTVALHERSSTEDGGGAAVLTRLAAVRSDRQDAWRLLLIATAGLGEVLMEDAEDGDGERHVLSATERGALRARLQITFGPAVTRPPHADADADVVAGGLLYALLGDDSAADEPLRSARR
jgi:hypothetical protein